jgi:hypothetical protein
MTDIPSDYWFPNSGFIEGEFEIAWDDWEKFAEVFGIKHDPIFIAWREANGEFLGSGEEPADGNGTVEP